MTDSSAAAQLDAAVDRVLATGRAAAGPELQPLVDVAARLRATLRPLPAGSRFEGRVAARLAGAGGAQRAIEALGELARRQLAHRERLIAAGAMSSAALGLTVTAYAVWRSSRRPVPVAQRLLHR